MSSSRPARPLATAPALAALDGESGTHEIVAGEIVRRAVPSPEHGSAQLALGAVLFGPFGTSRGGIPPGGWWLMTEVEVEHETHEVYRHDLVGWRRDRAPERPRERPVTLRPDWVCEILSASNAANDTVRKLRTLHRAGVPHYWLLDPERQTSTVLRWTPDGYLEVLVATAEETVRAEPFDVIELPLLVVFRQQ